MMAGMLLGALDRVAGGAEQVVVRIDAEHAAIGAGAAVDGRVAGLGQRFHQVALDDLRQRLLRSVYGRPSL